MKTPDMFKDRVHNVTQVIVNGYDEIEVSYPLTEEGLGTLEWLAQLAPEYYSIVQLSDNEYRFYRVNLPRG